MTRKLLIFIVAVAISLTLSGFAAAQTPIKFDSETISGLGARNIGSAAMSGRIAGDFWHQQQKTLQRQQEEIRKYAEHGGEQCPRQRLHEQPA